MDTNFPSEKTRRAFAPWPESHVLAGPLAWPTPNQTLFLDDGARFFARHRSNPDYGKPGWTRDCGRRFHKGMDIAPLKFAVTDKTTTVIHTDCATGRTWEGVETVVEPHDEIFAVLDGRAVAVNEDAAASDYGQFIVLLHTASATTGQGSFEFVTLYGHLSRVSVTLGQRVSSGDFIGAMGKTSRNAEARRWLDIAPHLHFEVARVRDPHWHELQSNKDAVGGLYNGQNLEPCDPVKFFARFLPR
jgi:murein DD-endopeptidase MepM/ murein hydrolase activator NlpD